MKGFLDNEDYSIGLLEQGSSFREVIDNCICEQTLQAEKNAFFVADLGNLMKKHNHWQKVMARTKPFYTVKCNSYRPVLEILAALGTNFACVNKNEMALVLSLGIAPENVLYASPCKQVSQIKYAAKVGINLMTCDNETELTKIARNHPNAKLLLHLATEDVSEDGEMSMKFGATLKSCMHLLEFSKELGVNVVGVKFHTSWSWKDSITYRNTLSDARCVFDMAKELGFNMNILDIGDGFFGTEFQLDKVYNIISPLLKRYFPEESGINVIAEPGSYFVSSAFTLAVNIIAKKVVSRDQLVHVQDVEMLASKPFIYYMNDGVYGSFACKLSDSFTAVPQVHKHYKADEPLFMSSLWGPSCDGLDQVVDHCLLPELDVGDWIIFESMGANTLGEPSTFSEFQKPPVYCFVSVLDWYEMQDAGVTLDTFMNYYVVPFHLSQED